MPRHIIATIISQEELKSGCFRMTLAASRIAAQAKPGQFVHVRCGAGLNPLLRRPLSIHAIGKGAISLLYNVVGKGTEWLAGKKAGEKIDLIGPLGNGFKIYKGSRSVNMLVAGGMGVAPLFALAQKIKKATKAGFIVVLGAKSRGHILCATEFKRLGAKLCVATEDGSAGRRMLATELAAEIVKKNRLQKKELCIYASGPMAMIKALCRLMEGCSLESQASLEERMACGVGACLGCVVDTQSGYKRVCKDGPVFGLCDIMVKGDVSLRYNYMI